MICLLLAGLTLITIGGSSHIIVFPTKTVLISFVHLVTWLEMKFVLTWLVLAWPLAGHGMAVEA
jgi:hypothetical protein